MADSYVARLAGKFQRIMGLVTSAGVGDAGKIPALDGSGRLDLSLMPVGVTAEVNVVPSSENLSGGDEVDLYLNGGVLTARKADASNGRASDGFVLAATASPANATVYREGANTGLSGLTIGQGYWLSDTVPGGVTATAPTDSGTIDQFLGEATSATTIFRAYQEPVYN